MKTVATEGLSSSTRERQGPERTLAALEKASGRSELYSQAAGATGLTAGWRPAASSLMSLNSDFQAMPPRWKSYSTSVLVHVGLIVFALIITFPLALQLKPPPPRFVLLTPQVQPYRPKVTPPRIKPPVLKAVVTPPPPVLKPPVIKPPVVKPQTLAAAPVIKDLPAVRVPKIEAAAPTLPPPPKPEIHTGVFTNSELAKGAPVPNQIKTGGFGDPNGAHPNPQSTSSMVAKLGGFDLPQGEAKGGAAGRGTVGQSGFGSLGDANGVPGGKGHRGTVQTSGFGDGAGAGTARTGQPGTVHAGGFGDATAPGPATAQHAAVTQPATTPIEILYKPKPVYTQEARDLKIEGQVAVEVVFEASGTVRIVRVLHGLGHGLDEAAEQAARQVRFRPATRGGVPVDTNATLYITFQLT